MTNDILAHDIPDEWEDLRDDLERTINKPVILAGGALRDFDHGLPAKDLDFFVPAGSFDEWHDLNGLILGQKDWFRDWSECNLYDTYGAMTNPEVRAIACYKAPNFDMKVNIIGLDLPEFDVYTVADRMDIGLCRIAYDGFTVYGSADYWSDKTNEEMTIRYVNDRALERSKRRFWRLKYKYPKHRMIIDRGEFVVAA